MKKSLAFALAFALALGTAVPAFAVNAAADAALPATISAGAGHCAVVMADGSLWMWGDNSYGQLGNGTTARETKPVKVLDGVTSVSCGQWITAAVKEDGSLWEWGRWDYENHLSPVKRAADVAAAAYASDASRAYIKEDGSLWWWGSYVKAKGSGVSSQKEPLKVADNVTCCSINDHTFGLRQGAFVKKDGSLWLWGASWHYSEISAVSGREDVFMTPVKVMDGVSSVSTRGTVAAVKKDGSLWMSGGNDYGQIGNGTLDDAPVPVKVMDNVVSACSGGTVTAAIKKDGSLWMWGSANLLGNGGKGTVDINESPREDEHVWIQPTPVKIMDNVSQVSIGDNFVLALKKDGTVWTWGRNGYGRLGNGSSGSEMQLTPVKVASGALVPEAAPVKEEPSAWAKELVEKAIAQNLVPKELQSKYTQPATRLEFCHLACTLYEQLRGEVTTRSTFTDTADPSVEKMASLGVVAGVGNNRFDPDSQLTREQAATMLAALAIAMDKPIEEAEPTFVDSEDISGWAKGFVGKMQVSGIMNGTGNNRFSPKGGYTREQSICTMLSMLAYLQED